MRQSKVDPSDVKKLAGDFGKVFRKTCAGKSKDDTKRWTQALAKVATIAGYHSNNWDNEAAMISKIATDISNKLNNSAQSSDFDEFVGMRAHLEKMEEMLCLDSNEVGWLGFGVLLGLGRRPLPELHTTKSQQVEILSANSLFVSLDNANFWMIQEKFVNYSSMMRL